MRRSSSAKHQRIRLARHQSIFAGRRPRFCLLNRDVRTFGHPEILIVGLAIDWAGPLRSYQAALVWARLLLTCCTRTEQTRFSPTEAIMGQSEHRVGIWRLSLEKIEATVADHLGRGRVPGNRPGPCFSRQVAMYLAKNVAGWSTTRIGRFYNGRHHTTVLHAIAKIERLRQDR